MRCRACSSGNTVSGEPPLCYRCARRWGGLEGEEIGRKRFAIAVSLGYPEHCDRVKLFAAYRAAGLAFQD